MAQISIIVSAYNESEILLDFYDCLLQKIRTFDYEIIFARVNRNRSPATSLRSA